MLLYTLTKNFMEVLINMLNAFGIILFNKVLWWFGGKNIGVEPKRPKFNPPYQHTSLNPVPNAQVCYFNNVWFMF